MISGSFAKNDLQLIEMHMCGDVEMYKQRHIVRQRGRASDYTSQSVPLIIHLDISTHMHFNELQVIFRKRATNHRALFPKEPLIIGLFCGK